MKQAVIKRIKKDRRHARVRKTVRGSADRPRLSVFRSARRIYAQLIDDTTGRTLAYFSSPKLKGGSSQKKVDQAKKVGEEIGRLALAKGIQKAAFDRGGYRYHGRVKAVAEGAREAGLKF